MPDTMSNFLTFIINTGLLAALIGVTISGLNLLRTYIETKTQELQTQIKNDAVKAAIDKAENVIWTVVMQLAQEVADDLKEKSSDGKLTLEEIRTLRSTAWMRANEMMGNETVALLKEYTTDFESWLYSKIDAYAREAKR